MSILWRGTINANNWQVLNSKEGETTCGQKKEWKLHFVMSKSMTEVEWGDVRGHQWKACKAPVGPEPTRAMRKRL